MSEIDAIAPATARPAGLAESNALPAPEPQAAPGANGFADFLTNGVEAVEHKIDAANELVRAFALDDSIPVHQVTIALEEARLAVELAVQVRTRVIEAYREIMNMQL